MGQANTPSFFGGRDKGHSESSQEDVKTSPDDRPEDTPLIDRPIGTSQKKEIPTDNYYLGIVALVVALFVPTIMDLFIIAFINKRISNDMTKARTYVRMAFIVAIVKIFILAAIIVTTVMTSSKIP